MSRRIGPRRWLLLALSCQLAGAARPPSTPTTQEIEARRRQDWYLLDNKWVRPTAKLAWQDLLRIEPDDGKIAIRSKPSERAEILMHGGREPLVAVEGSPLLWVINTRGRGWEADGVTPNQYLTAMCKTGDVRPGDGMQPQEVRVTPGQVTVTGTRLLAGAAVRVMLEINSSPAAMMVTVERERGGRSSFTTKDISELVRGHPDETRSAVAPLLRALGLNGDALNWQSADVYAAFPDVQPSKQSIADVQQILPAVASADPKHRDDAMAQLERLGPPGVLAAMRIDPRTLSPEQRTRLERFVAKHRLAGAEPAPVKDDPFFLIDCLTHPDRDVRAAAKARLERLLGRTLPTDAQQPAGEGVLDQLRSDVRERQKAGRPTSQ